MQTSSDTNDQAGHALRADPASGEKTPELSPYELLLVGGGTSRDRTLAAQKLTDEQLWKLLVRQRRDLKAEIKRASARVGHNSHLLLQLIVVFIGIGLSSLLLIGPFILQPEASIAARLPEYVIILSAFMVAIFIYFFVVIFRQLIAQSALSRQAKVMIADGVRALEETEELLESVQKREQRTTADVGDSSILAARTPR